MPTKVFENMPVKVQSIKSASQPVTTIDLFVLGLCFLIEDVSKEDMDIDNDINISDDIIEINTDHNDDNNEDNTFSEQSEDSDSNSSDSETSSDESQQNQIIPNCGVCKKRFSDQKMLGPKFITKCILCKKDRLILKSCLSKILPHSMNQKELIRNMTIEQFQKTKINFYCVYCKDLCFWCRKDHTSKYLYNLHH